MTLYMGGKISSYAPFLWLSQSERSLIIERWLSRPCLGSHQCRAVIVFPNSRNHLARPLLMMIALTGYGVQIGQLRRTLHTAFNFCVGDNQIVVQAPYKDNILYITASMTATAVFGLVDVVGKAIDWTTFFDRQGKFEFCLPDGQIVSHETATNRYTTLVLPMKQ